jgi:hypothetical protein
MKKAIDINGKLDFNRIDKSVLDMFRDNSGLTNFGLLEEAARDIASRIDFSTISTTDIVKVPE